MSFMKSMADKQLHPIITSILQQEDNKYCVECVGKDPKWASWNLGVFLCTSCAEIHRKLGVHISKVKSVNLADNWTSEHLMSMQAMGNSKSKAVYEANIPDDFRRPQTVSSLESFIREKYVTKKYTLSGWVPALPQNVTVCHEEACSRDTSPALPTSCPSVESRTAGTPAVFMEPLPPTSTTHFSTCMADIPGLSIGSSTLSPHQHPKSFFPPSASVTANPEAGASIPNNQAAVATPSVASLLKDSFRPPFVKNSGSIPSAQPKQVQSQVGLDQPIVQPQSPSQGLGPKMSKKPKPSSTKLSELEFEIKLLEQTESTLPERETYRLNNLREQLEMQKMLGLIVQKTVPAKLLKNYESLAQKSEIKDNEKQDKSESKKTRIAHGFNYFVREIKIGVAQKNPDAALEMSSVWESWRGLSRKEKLTYKKKAQEEKENVVDSSEVGDDKRKERDRGYRKRQAIQKLTEKENQESVQKELLSMLETKKRKLESLIQLKVSLSEEITSANAEISVVKNIINDHDDEEIKLKSDIKLYLNHHKMCKK